MPSSSFQYTRKRVSTANEKAHDKICGYNSNIVTYVARQVPRSFAWDTSCILALNAIIHSDDSTGPSVNFQLKFLTYSNRYNSVEM